MARIEMECTVCHARVVSSDVSEVIAWDKSHGQRCMGPRPCACGIAKEGETTGHPAGDSITHVAHPGECAASSIPPAPTTEEADHG